MPDQTPNAQQAASSESPRNDPSASNSSKGNNRGWIWVLLVAIIVGGGIFFFARQGKGQAGQVPDASFATQALPITTASAQRGDIGVYVNALGTVTPVYTVSVTSRVVGAIMSVNYTEGQIVHKGDSLLEIDARPYQAALTQAEGQLAHDQAVLNEARIDLDRYQAALARNAIAKRQVDDQNQVVQQDEGTVKNDQGTVDNARLNLAYCSITSPIDGRVGLRLVDPGNIVQANGTNPLVVITQLQPITVVFSVAEDYLPQIQQQLRGGHRMLVDALDRDQQKKIASGTLLTLDNQIDTTTGTIRLKAIFQNTDFSLFPNQFVNARLLVDTQHGDVLIPSAAIQRNAQGAFVYAVKPDQTVAMQPVTTGATDGNVTAVQGIEPGAVIALDNFDKLQDGIKVAVRQAPNDSSQKAGS
jgi:multidrug efflux system membrane fusion protein